MNQPTESTNGNVGNKNTTTTNEDNNNNVNKDNQGGPSSSSATAAGASGTGAAMTQQQLDDESAEAKKKRGGPKRRKVTHGKKLNFLVYYHLLELTPLHLVICLFDDRSHEKRGWFASNVFLFCTGKWGLWGRAGAEVEEGSFDE